MSDLFQCGYCGSLTPIDQKHPKPTVGWEVDTERADGDTVYLLAAYCSPHCAAQGVDLKFGR